MDITKHPQFQLYLFTLNLLRLKSLLIPRDCDDRCINSTIINRAYFSSYLFCVLWLEYVKNFRPMPLKGFKSKEERISEHVQVRNALKDFGKKTIGYKLSKLSELRKKADYDSYVDLTPNDVSDAVNHMEQIFNCLKFE